jgi:nickel transport protein
MRNLLLAVALSCFSCSVLAHNVVGGVYAIGTEIEGEVGFSNGDMAAQGTKIRVTDSQGNELAVLETDADGLFAFTATQRMDHQFFADLSSGHVLALALPADELPDSLPGGNKVTGVSVVAPKAPTAFSGDQQALQQMIERAVAKQVKPLRKEIAEYKEKASLQDVMGGIGYIFGLCGMGIWWRQRQLDKQAKG